MKHMKHPRTLVLIAALLTSANALAAAGDGKGFAVNRFDPSERGSLWLTQESLDFRGDFRFSAGLTLDYAKRPLGIYDADDELVADLLAHQLYGHLGASFVFLNRLRLGFSVPVALYQEGGDAMVNGTRFSAPNAVAMGDLRLSADVRLFGQYGDAFSLAFGAQLYLPTGKRGQYTGDEGVRVQPRVMVAGEVGNFVYAAKVGFHYRANEDGSLNGDFKLGSELNLGVAIGWQFLDKKLLVGPEFNGGTVVTQGGKNTFDDKTSPAEVLLGARYAFDSGVTLAGGGGLGLWRALGSPQMRWVLSVGYEMPVVQKKPDFDSDGVPDELDACPRVAGAASDDPAKHGCPLDTDEGGIPDDKDACPDVPGQPSKRPERHGCPPDCDGDSIVDAEDACPELSGKANADPKLHGCPVNPDRDGDGILNEKDACPDVKGAPSKHPERNGCPRVFIQGEQIVIQDQVRFVTGSAKIAKTRQNERTLKAVKVILESTPRIHLVRVEGHTDNVGTAAYNRKLSAERAASVIQWLIDAGIAEERLSSEGFGPDQPIAPNETAKERALNRRVEFHIAEMAPEEW